MIAGKRHSRGQRGAALIVAVGVLTILLIISATFFQITRQELQTARNTANNIRAELLVEGSFSIAEAFLNHDLAIHPTYTSLDSAWNTYFNNTWALGKHWMWADHRDIGDGNFHLISNRGLMTSTVNGVPGIPEIDLGRMSAALGLTVTREMLGDAIYIPRTDPVNMGMIEQNAVPPTGFVPGVGFTNATAMLNQNFVVSTDLNISPFATANNVFETVNVIGGAGGVYSLTMSPSTDLLPVEQIHFYTDVDNDGDGLNDSVWIPIAGDLILDQDGLDNNMDGTIDEPGEPGVFFYRRIAGTNDIVGLLDDIDNAGLNPGTDTEIVFTVPFPFLVFDSDEDRFVQALSDDDLGDVLIGTTTPATQGAGVFAAERNSILYEGRVFDLDGNSVPTNLFTPGLDNDYNLVVDDPTDASHILLRREALLDSGAGLHPYRSLISALVTAGVYRVQAEPVSEIIGRVAILIRDEASKVNLNTAGGNSHIPVKGSTPLERSHNDGIGPHEFELSVLPGVEPIRADRLWTEKMGGPQGGAVAMASHFIFRNWSFAPYRDYLDPFDVTAFSQYEALAYDVSTPGYGYVDDNANILQLSLNGLDDDGDALYYQNDGFDNDGNGLVDDIGEGLIVGVDEGFRFFNYDDIDQNNDGNFLDDLATPEGMDEPGEFQRFRPLRNRVAEGDIANGTASTPETNFGLTDDPADNDGDDAIDEIGELGDHNYKTHQQVKATIQFERDSGNTLAPTPQAFHDKVQSFLTVHSTDKNERRRQYALTAFDRNFDGPLNPDYDLIRERLTPSERTVSGLKLDYNVALAGEIARAIKSDWAYAPSEPFWHFGVNTLTNFGDDSESGFPAMPRAFAAGLRREDTTVVADDTLMNQFAAVAGGTRTIFKSDDELRAHQLAVNIKDSADFDFARTVDTSASIFDRWWQALSQYANLNAVRNIYYTQAGIEPIRINEIMVRPTRRIEAEVFFNNATEYNPNIFGANDFNVRTTTTLDRLTSLNWDLIGGGPASWNMYDQPLATNLSLMGLRTAAATYRSYQAVRIPDPNTVNSFENIDIFDVAQFSFTGSEELPPGRYYATVDTRVLLESGLVNSVNDTFDFSFIYKTSTIYDDLFDDGDSVPEESDLFFLRNADLWRTPAALNNMGRAFMQYMPPTNDLQTIRNSHFGFTVEIPPGDSGQYLHIGIRSNLLAGEALAINFFEFSQEPDHEWVEVVNIDPDNAYDLSGWQLVVEGPQRTVATVPDQTFIAPGGSLLMGFNKFDWIRPLNSVIVDGLQFAPGSVPDIDLTIMHRNGIGLARGRILGTNVLENITAPQTFTVNGDPFNRGTDEFDYVDRDGDGLSEDVTADNIIQSTAEPIGTLQRDTPDKSWDRIVELKIEAGVSALSQLSAVNKQYIVDFSGPLDDAGLVGRIVLNGGFFPNEPEFDNIDNDNDNAELSNDNIDNDGDYFFLASDGKDNNVNGITDNPAVDPEGVDEFSEGIDEGRFRREAFDLGTGRFHQVPGGFDAFDIPFRTGFGIFEAFDAAGSFYLSHLGNDTDPPRWKEFTERHLFPGDNVIVSLYEGSALNNRVVDRITYSQRDVDNASIDDVLNVAAGRFALDSRFPSFWPDNTMGIDFYKSLQRKHPFYNGDRFGTQNRFQATDGNYDDWAESMTRFERQVNLENPGAVLGTLDRLNASNSIYNLTAHTYRASPLSPNLTQRLAENFNLSETTGAFLELGQFDTLGQGTPLLRRWHFTKPRVHQRPFLSPGDAAVLHHFDRTEQVFSRSEAGYLLDLASPNIAFLEGSGGTVHRVDSTIHQTVVGQTIPPIRAQELFDGPNNPIYNPLFPETSRFLSFFVTNDFGFATDPATPHDYSDDLRAVLSSSAASDPVVLSVGQADVYPILRGTTGTLGNFVWDFGTNNLPNEWVPAAMYNLQGENLGDSIGGGVLRHQFLIDSFEHGGIAPSFIGANRSPILSRAAFYASYNFNDFDSRPDLGNDLINGERIRDGAQALFVWNADDGLEDGEYDLYVVVTDDLTKLAELPGVLLTPFAADIISEASETRDVELQLDIDAFTDRNADRRVWLGFAEEYPNFTPLLQSQLFEPGGSFGMIYDQQPTPNGVIRYGTVRVENNFLALRIRNRSNSGIMNRFTRVILAPKNKTPGRININTVQTMRATELIEPSPRLFNTLTGLPGITMGYNEVTGFWGVQKEELLNFIPVEILPLGADEVPPRVETGDIRTGYLDYRNDVANTAYQSNPFDAFLTRPSLNPRDVAQVFRAEKIVGLRGRHTDPNYFRFEHVDGRYYEFPADLLTTQYSTQNNRIVSPDILSDIVDRGIDGFGEPAINNGSFDEVIEPLRFDENYNRFRRIANMITTRSDVFEIRVTVQVGNGTDANGDGRINWRDDREFSPLATKRARTVYER